MRLGLVRELRALAAAEWPREACGFLLARAGELVAVRGARNVAARPLEGFMIDPLETLAVALDAERDGLVITGVWHSHPDGTGAASACDTAGGVAGWANLVVRGQTPCHHP